MPKLQQLQRGTMRTNCLDCLDRTNRVQTYLGLDALGKMLEDLGVSDNGVIVQRFTAKLEEMWKDNGNRISQIYAGTGALQGSKVGLSDCVYVVSFVIISILHVV